MKVEFFDFWEEEQKLNEDDINSLNKTLTILEAVVLNLVKGPTPIM